jgi:S1-C subfamily serine protease
VRSLAIAVIFVLGTAFPATAQDPIAPDVLQKLKQAAVFVKVSLGPLDLTGSGFVLQTAGQDVYIATNEHVVAKPNLEIPGLSPLGLRGRDLLELRRIQAAIQNLEPEVSVVFNSGTPDEQVLKAQTLAADKELDLALLKVSGVKRIPEPIQLDTAFQPTETTPVFIFGFPFGDALSKSKGNPAITVGRGTISSLRRDDQGEESSVQIDGALNPGNSGGPVVDAKGRLVGVAVATIKGSGIGFAIPPAKLQKMLSGGVSEVKLVDRSTREALVVEITLTLLDPFHKIRQIAVHCVTRDLKTGVPPPQQPLDGSQKVELVLKDGKATGTWNVQNTADKPAVISLQPAVIDDQGNTVYLAATRHPFASVPPLASRPRPTIPAPRPLAAASRKVHHGATNDLGDGQLTGGVLVFDRNPAVGFGVVQTGEQTMDFTYVALVRLPSVNFGRTSFVTRNKQADSESRVFYGAYLDDQTMTVEHRYTAENGKLREEQLTVLDQSFQLHEGRLFLVDLQGATPRVVQKKIDLPARLPLAPIDDEHLLELADKTLDGLLKDDAVRAFVKDGKLPKP